MRQANLPPNRQSILPSRVNNEWNDVCDILDLVIQEIGNKPIVAKEPDFFAVEFDRQGKDGVDRHTDYVLGKVVQYLIAAGWLETSFSLENGNKTIKLWIK